MDKNNYVSLVLYKESSRLCEIFQSLDIKFSFVTEKEGAFTQITSPGKCRDFLGDLLWSRQWGKPVSIYGFMYDYLSNPYDDDALKLSLEFPAPSVMEIFLSKVEEYIWKKEKEAGLSERTRIFLPDKKNTVIIVAPKEWQDTIWALSLYTFYLKIVSYETVKSPEDGYLSKLTKEREAKFLSKVGKTKRIINSDLHTSHNRSGFVSILSGDNLEDYKNIFEG